MAFIIIEKMSMYKKPGFIRAMFCQLPAGCSLCVVILIHTSPQPLLQEIGMLPDDWGTCILIRVIHASNSCSLILIRVP